MAKFFEGGQKEVKKTIQNNTASRRIPNVVKNVANDTVKQVNRETIARQAQQQYSNVNNADVVKSVSQSLDAFTKKNQPLNRLSVKEAGSPVVNRDSFRYQFKGAGQYTIRDNFVEDFNKATRCYT